MSKESEYKYFDEEAPHCRMDELEQELEDYDICQTCWYSAQDDFDDDDVKCPGYDEYCGNQYEGHECPYYQFDSDNY